MKCIWNYENDDVFISRTYELTDDSLSAKNHLLNIMINDRPCIDGNLSINIANTDFDNVFEYIQIGLNNDSVLICNPNKDNSCTEMSEIKHFAWLI